MPLFKTIKVDFKTSVYIWQITEDADDLGNNLQLTPASISRVQGMKSHIHRCGFLCIRHMLAIEGYVDADLFYDEYGKPHLMDGKFISITHSFDYAAIIVSDKPVGIDIEKVRSKITRIVKKFIGFESVYLNPKKPDYMVHLTAIWCAKESLYKLFAIPGLSFKSHLKIQEFDSTEGQLMGECHHDVINQKHKLVHLSLGDYHCAYTIN